MKIINLLNGQDFCPIFDIEKRLEEGFETRSLIYTNKLRGVGKTGVLINFAKKHGFTVVVPLAIMVETLRKDYNYCNIFGQTSIELRGRKRLVIDEGVVFNDIVTKENVLTGFTTLENKRDKKKKDLTFNEDIVNFLKQEEEMLREKMNRCLDRNDISMYKNLVHSYTQILELINTYDYKLIYSEYTSDNENGQRQVSIWEQNSDGIVRNYKVWNVKEDSKFSEVELQVLDRAKEELIEVCNGDGYFHCCDGNVNITTLFNKIKN